MPDEMRAGIEGRRPPPYVSYKTWNTFLERAKGHLPLPQRMDSSFWSRLPFSGSNQSALKGALVFLGLVGEDDRPGAELEQLIQAQGADRQVLLRRTLTRSYGQLLGQVDLSRATHGQLRDYFRSVGAEGQVGQKCTVFFLSLAREAGEKPHVSLQARALPVRGKKGARRVKRKPFREPAALPEPQIPSSIDLGVLALLQKLPRTSSAWDKQERQNWKRAFDALFEFLYPVKDLQ